MKALLLTVLLSACSASSLFSQRTVQPKGTDSPATRASVTNTSTVSSKGTATGDWAWTVQPFNHKVFIENRGQFDKLVNNNSKVLFGAQLGDNLFAYFTTNGIVYRLSVYPKLKEALKKEAEKPGYDPDKGDIHPVITYFNCEWKGSNPDATIDAKEEQTDYYTYPSGPSSCVVVNIFKKIIYHNIYPGIDAEYTFLSGKQGFKYALIVHPGADLSKVKLQYTSAKDIQADVNGNITIQTNVGEIIDHAPVSRYQEGGDVNSSYNLSGNEESFVTAYDKSKTLVIDPWVWTSSPGLNTNKAYDIDYDNAGNVYVYGSSGTWQLAMFNNAGVKQWTYNASLLSTGYYGDFACDKLSGKCFCTEGFNASGMDAVEVSNTGIQLGTKKTVANLQEGWRDAWDPCKSVIVIGGGSWQTTCDAGGLMDTNLNITPVNVLNENAVEEGHDMALTCVDPNGTQCYMASTQSAGDPGNFPNIMAQFPVPALAPAVYMAPTGYNFQESNVAQYVGPSTANGLNGMAASPNWLYIYDGAKLKRVNKATGTIISTVNVTGTSEQWGGLDVDNCDNIYVGENSSIQVYNSSLSLSTTYAANNTVYDVVLGSNFQSLYACGNGFLSYMILPSSGDSIAKTRTNSACTCSGTASAQLLACGQPVAGVSYLWSNGATTSNVSALCPGTYTITISQPGCSLVNYTDTVLIKKTGAGNFTLSFTQTNLKCYGDTTGVTTVTPKGGSAPYTYAWAPSGGSNAKASDLSAGTYTVSVTDSGGCTVIDSATITQPTAIKLAASAFSVSCFGNKDGQVKVVPSGGTGLYTYLWTPGGTNATITGLSANTYSITVTDANGCTKDTSVVVIEPALLRDSIAASANELCNSDSKGSATVGVAGGTTPYAYSWTSGAGTNATATALTAGSYTVTVKDKDGCTATASVMITQPPALDITTNTESICLGRSATLTPGYSGGTPLYTYNWVPNLNLSCNTCPNPIAGPATTTVYTVTVTDANGCTKTATDTVNVSPPVILVAGTSQGICPGNNVTLSSNASGGSGAYTYTWSPAASLSCTTCQNPVATPTVTTTYTIDVTDDCGTSDSAFVTITVYPSPMVSFAADTLSGCVPLCTTFKDLSSLSSGNITSWAWNFGDNTGTDTLQTAHHCYTVPGKYTVSLKVTSDKGCTSTLVTPGMISVYSLPVAAFNINPQPVTILHPTIQFTDKSTDAYGISSWLWNFGDISDATDTLQNPSYKYQDTGTYCASLKVTNIYGCADSITECLVISPQFTLYIPDAFSPNGDGLDDIFMPKGQYVSDFKMYIFDRWGMMLYSTDDIYKGWNGTVNSNVCQVDTYVYLITCKDNFGNKHSYLGKVTLIK